VFYDIMRDYCSVQWY